MTSAWGLVKKIHEKSAFDGEGAKRFGGRWNRRGTVVVYLSESLALAVLEMFVHFGKAAVGKEHVAFQVEIPEEVEIEEIDRTDLPSDWREEPPSESTKRIGTDWVIRGSTTILRVPSVIVPQESNLVVNVAHAGFGLLRIGESQPFRFDPRMD